MSKFGKDLIDSMKQAAAHAGGRKVPRMRVKTVEIPDVKAIRKVRQEDIERLRQLWDDGKASGKAKPLDIEGAIAGAKVRLKKVRRQRGGAE